MEEDVKVFGFWVYLMTDLVIFATLFATYLVLQNNTYNGPSGHQIFEAKTVVQETIILLTSSFTCSLGTLATVREKRYWAVFWFFITALLGVAFLYLEITEFSQFYHQGDGPQRSAFLSSFFTLVGTHGLHISCGLVWMAVMMIHLSVRPLIPHISSQVYRMAFFWHFLDLVWIFIFTIVYGMGILNA